MERIEYLKHHSENRLRVRCDANNLWNDSEQAIDFLLALDFSFFAIEEPLPVGRYEDLLKIAEVLGTRIILDESFLRIEQFPRLMHNPDTWIVNARISKMGGLLRSISIAEAAKSMGIELIVGAHVGETSLLTRAALTVANSSRDLLIGQEGAFGTWLLASDVCTPPVIFKQGGILESKDMSCTAAPGFGLNIDLQYPLIQSLS